VIKLTRMRLERQVVYMGKRIGAYKVWWGNLTESDHLEDFSVDIRISYIRGSLRYRVGGVDWIDLAQDRGRFLFTQQ